MPDAPVGNAGAQVHASAAMAETLEPGEPKARKANRVPRAVAAVAAVALLAVPWVTNLGILNAAIKGLIAALFALAFNLMMGQAGLLSFGQSAYFGAGAFATIHLMRGVASGLPVPIVALPLAGAGAGLGLGLVCGWFATKRTGTYFAMVTLAIAELLYALALRWTHLFGGEAGISSMRMPWAGLTWGSTTEVYYLVLAWTSICAVLLFLYSRTPFGRLTLAIRDNEARTRFLGYDTHRTKVAIFGISAMFSGVAGALLAIAEEAVSYAVFDAKVSTMVVLQTFIGGCTTFLGPALGAALLTLFAQEISDVSRSWLLYQGVLFVMVMMYAPTGIGGMVASLCQTLRSGQHRTEEFCRRLRACPRLVCGGILVVAAIVFAVETCGIVFSEKYTAMRRAAGDRFVPIGLFGATWDPAAPWLWATPIVLLAAGLVLLPALQERAARAFRAISPGGGRGWAGGGDR